MITAELVMDVLKAMVFHKGQSPEGAFVLFQAVKNQITAEELKLIDTIEKLAEEIKEFKNTGRPLQ